MSHNDNPKSCIPISISLFIAPKGDTHHITLGITRGCKDNGDSTWTLTFLLEEKSGSDWVKRVDFKLDINVDAPSKTQQAEKLADTKKLDQKQADFVTGPMYVAAVRESKHSAYNAELVELLIREAQSASVDGELKASEEQEDAKHIESLLREVFAGTSRPTLKQLSIMFLDIN